MEDQPLSEDYVAPIVPLAADGSRADLPEGAVMENGMKNQSSSAGRFYGRSVIYGKDGEHNTPYMTRYWIGRLRLHIFYRGDHDPDPHDHPWGFWTFPLTSYVEEVVEHDAAAQDEFILTKLTYEEWVRWQNGETSHRFYRTRRQIVRAFWPHYRPATHTHRVLGRARVQGFNADWSLGHVVGEGRIVTIVWRGKDERKWGFLKNRDGRWCWVAWRDYVFANGKSAPCE